MSFTANVVLVVSCIHPMLLIKEIVGLKKKQRAFINFRCYPIGKTCNLYLPRLLIETTAAG